MKTKIKSFINTLLQKYNGFEKKQKIIVLFIAVVVVVDLVLALGLLFGKKSSKVKLESAGSQRISSLIALDKCGRSGLISDNQYANFKFTSEQKKEFVNVYEKNGSVALTVRIKLNPTKRQNQTSFSVNDLPFKFGFLDKSDFKGRGKFIKQIYPNNHRILIQGNEKNAPYVFDVSFGLPKNKEIEKYIPEGFFIYSSMKCKILGACVVPCQIGFDSTTQVPYYGFASNGGIIDFTNRIIDFSGASLAFPVQNTSYGFMPELCFTLNDSPDFKANLKNSVKIEVNIGGEKLFINNVAPAKKVIIPTAALKAPFTRLELISNGDCVSSVLLRASEAPSGSDNVPVPVKTDPGLILNYNQSNWRNVDFEIFEWDRFDRIIFFDIRNYAIQDNFFRRMAFFAEKTGYKGTLVSDEVLEGKHAFNAHDYSSETMARFFNKVQEENFKLNNEELLLKKILLKTGILVVDESNASMVKPNGGGLVSISRETPEWSRRRLLAHEGWHTLFFRDEEFRNYVSAVYYTTDAEAIQFIKDFWTSQPDLGYDQTDNVLMQNEFMAYIMQQPLSEVANNFVGYANWQSVIKQFPNTSSYVRKTEGRAFEDAATAMNEFVFDKYGIVCGNINLVAR